MSRDDLFALLDLTLEASEADIKRAFYSKAQQYHPDKEGGDTKHFMRIMAAYEVLKDTHRRQAYIARRSASFSSMMQGGDGDKEFVLTDADITELMSRFRTRYAHILEEFENMVREDQVLQKQIREREGASLQNIVEDVLGPHRILGHLLNDWEDYFPTYFQAVVPKQSTKPAAASVNQAYKQKEATKKEQEGSGVSRNPVPDIGKELFIIRSGPLAIGSIVQGAFDKQKLNFLFGGPNVIMATATCEAPDVVTLSDSKGTHVGKIVHHQKNDKENNDTTHDKELGERTRTVFNEKEEEVLHCFEKRNWAGRLDIYWREPGGDLVATIERRRPTWEFKIQKEILHPCFFLFDAGYRAIEDKALQDEEGKQNDKPKGNNKDSARQSRSNEQKPALWERVQKKMSIEY